jgi:hypothetical protein
LSDALTSAFERFDNLLLPVSLRVESELEALLLVHHQGPVVAKLNVWTS